MAVGEASGSRLDTWPGQLRTAQPQQGAWSLEAADGVAGTAGRADSGDLRAQATAAGGVGATESREPLTPLPGCPGDSEAQEDTRLRALHPASSVQPAKVFHSF